MTKNRVCRFSAIKLFSPCVVCSSVISLSDTTGMLDACEMSRVWRGYRLGQTRAQIMGLRGHSITQLTAEMLSMYHHHEQHQQQTVSVPEMCGRGYFGVRIRRIASASTGFCR